MWTCRSLPLGQQGEVLRYYGTTDCRVWNELLKVVGSTYILVGMDRCSRVRNNKLMISLAMTISRE